MGREQRRRPEGVEDEPPLARSFHPGDPDVPEPHLENSGHKKKTADNWNR